MAKLPTGQEKPRRRSRLLPLALLGIALNSACWFDDACGTPTESEIPPLPPLPGPPTGALALTCEGDSDDGGASFTIDLVVPVGLPPYRYTVDFGDGNSTSGTFTSSGLAGGRVSLDHDYPPSTTPEPTAYTVRATVQDQQTSASCTLAQSVQPPRLDLDCLRTPEEGTVPLTVTCTARPSGCVGPCQVSWFFGDTGEIVPGRTVVHTFTAPGSSALQTWAARGMLEDGPGRSTECRRGIIVRPAPGPDPEPAPGPTPPPNPIPTPTPTIPTPPPNRPPVIAGFASSRPSVTAGGPAATLTGTVSDPDGDPVTWTLTLDPASTATGTFTPSSGSGNVSAQFAAPASSPQGTAILRLTVSDGRGGTAQATVTVNVILG